MAITFACDCGKTLRARDELAGKKARCPQCGSVRIIPQPEVSAAAEEDDIYGLQDPEPRPAPSQSLHRDETALRPASSSTAPTRRPAPAAKVPASRAHEDDES